MSLIFAWYVSSIADYGSIYGSLATVIVILEYLYLSVIVFLTGIQIDALARDSVEGSGEHTGELVSPGGQPAADQAFRPEARQPGRARLPTGSPFWVWTR